MGIITTTPNNQAKEPVRLQQLKAWRNTKFSFVFLAMFIILFAAILLASSIGPVNIPFHHTMAILAKQLGLTAAAPYSERDLLIVLQIRLPRVLVGGLVGAALGVSGAAMQGLFRNPLVEPGYVGVSSGAAVGAVCALFFGWNALGLWAVPLSAFAGAVAAIFLILGVWQSSRLKSIATLLLLGIGINAMLSALINIMVASSNTEQELRSIVFWLQGGLEARTWEHVQLIAMPIILGSLITIMYSRDLNMMLLGDEQATSAGIPVRRTRFTLLILTSLMTGAAVAVSGIISFVGLVVPHMIRLLIGPDYRFLLPMSAIGGAIFLILADLVSRMILQPVTLQVGVVCACIGAPLFIALIWRARNGGITE
ncbi:MULTISPECIES: FecCD family ABC transporter permease [unclassified Paenibacillus]|uniref:FecCD family ABC transporter permease n=1 Tax=unclassified Paenibacillus TaxID=185978 RepID=UPI002F414BFF